MSSVSMIPCPRLYSPGRLLFSHKICMTPMCCSCLFVWSHGSQRRKTDEVMEVSVEKPMKSWKSAWSHGSQRRKTGFDGHRHSILYVPHELRYDVVVQPLCVRSQTDRFHNTWIHKWIRIPSGNEDHDRSRRVPQQSNAHCAAQKKTDPLKGGDMTPNKKIEKWTLRQMHVVPLGACTCTCTMVNRRSFPRNQPDGVTRMRPMYTS